MHCARIWGYNGGQKYLFTLIAQKPAVKPPNNNMTLIYNIYLTPSTFNLYTNSLTYILVSLSSHFSDEEIQKKRLYDLLKFELFASRGKGVEDK